MHPIEQVDRFLRENAHKGCFTPDGALVETLKEAVGKALMSLFAAKEARFPRASSLGYGARRLFYTRTDPVEEDLSAMAEVFMHGHVLEAIELALMGCAGLEIRNAHSHVATQIGKHTIPGSIDLEMKFSDGWGVVDIKTCNSWAFQNKWKDAESFLHSDHYGYMEQAVVYSKGRNLPFKGWWLINKDTGKRKFFSADLVRQEMDYCMQELEHKLDAAYGDELPPPCFPVAAEEYHPKGGDKRLTGNFRVDNACSRCPYVERCFPHATKARRGVQTIYYIGEVKSLIPGVIIEGKINEKEEHKLHPGNNGN